MALQATGIADLVATTINELNPLRFTDITSALQRHIVMKRLLKKNKVIFTGQEFQWDIMTNNNGSAEWKGLYSQDNVNVPDVMTQAKVPWRHITWNWAIEHREISINSGSPQRIVELAQTRRMAAFISAVEAFETAAWRCPASTDDVRPYGIPYWIVKSATAATYTNNDGFNGTAGSGYTVVGNVNPTTYARWRNYAAPYSAITPEDLMAAWRRAATKTDFESPMEGMPVFNTGDDYAYYTNYAVLGPLEVLLTAQNENLGTDLASMDGKVVFRRVPVVYVPALEDDTTGPVYGINWGEFKTAGLKGEWNRESVVPMVANQHNVAATHTDCSLNWFTFNRRRHFVLSNGTTMPS